jgi:ferredoxin
MITYQETRINDDLIEVYTSLSEVFMPSVQAGLPEWFALPGREWPFYEASIRLAKATQNSKLEQCAIALSEVPISSLDSRLSEYEKLFVGEGSPPIWLYESHYIGGRIFGPISFSIHNIYKDAGLEIAGSELADHAGLELAFLAFLVDKENTEIEFRNEWKQARDLFTKNHAGRWLPEVGKQMSRSGDPGWSAIGLLVISIFSSDVTQKDRNNIFPNIEEPDLCTLCGFCVQVCPTQALRIHEDGKTTFLRLETGLCTSCVNCRNICPENVLSLRANLFTQAQVLLRESPLSKCSICGDATFSQAELDYTKRVIGNPDWLAYCIKCRSGRI